jgi:hypothetical protein
VPFRGTGGRQNPSRAKLGRDELHDGVQFGGRELPDDLPYPRHAANRRRHHWRQCQSEHGVSAQLHDATDDLPDHLRADLAIAVSAADYADQLKAAMDSVIESIAFSVAARPTAMDSAAR